MIPDEKNPGSWPSDASPATGFTATGLLPPRLLVRSRAARNEFTNAGGVITFPIILSGNYLVSSNGRTAASISNLSNNLVFYLISGSDAYVLQNDSGVQITGTLGKQN